jgi:hypothetical protein
MRGLTRSDPHISHYLILDFCRKGSKFGRLDINVFRMDFIDELLQLSFGGESSIRFVFRRDSRHRCFWQSVWIVLLKLFPALFSWIWRRCEWTFRRRARCGRFDTRSGRSGSTFQILQVDSPFVDLFSFIFVVSSRGSSSFCFLPSSFLIP